MIKQCFVCSKDFVTFPSKLLLKRGKYCSKQCCMEQQGKELQLVGKETRFGNGLPPWNKKGFHLTSARKDGRKYRMIFVPEHPFATNKGYVREHRLVMEQSIDRYLEKSEMVHHINGDTLDNNLSNLELMSGADHRREHLKDNVHKRWIVRNKQ